MKNLVSRFVKDESGATAIEYGLIAAGIAIAIITAVKGVGSALTHEIRGDQHVAQIDSADAFSMARTIVPRSASARPSRSPGPPPKTQGNGAGRMPPRAAARSG